MLFVITLHSADGPARAASSNVGYWFQNQRACRPSRTRPRWQAAQSDHDTFANSRPTLRSPHRRWPPTNWNGSTLDAVPVQGRRRRQQFRAPGKAWLKIDIETQHPSGYLFKNMLTFLHVPLDDLTFSAARRRPSTHRTGSARWRRSPIRCPDPCTPPWPGWTEHLQREAHVAARPAEQHRSERRRADRLRLSRRLPQPCAEHVHAARAVPGRDGDDIEQRPRVPAIRASQSRRAASTSRARRTDLDSTRAASAADRDDSARRRSPRARRRTASWTAARRRCTTSDPTATRRSTSIGFAAVTFESTSIDGLGDSTAARSRSAARSTRCSTTSRYDARTRGLYDFGVRTIGLSG